MYILWGKGCMIGQYSKFTKMYWPLEFKRIDLIQVEVNNSVFPASDLAAILLVVFLG